MPGNFITGGKQLGLLSASKQPIGLARDQDKTRGHEILHGHVKPQTIDDEELQCEQFCVLAVH